MALNGLEAKIAKKNVQNGTQKHDIWPFFLYFIAKPTKN
jgi:hypothetical protein